MAIAHDTNTRFPTTDGTSGTNSSDTTTGDRSFNHAGAAGAKGAVVVLICTGNTTTVTGVTYGGVAMTLRQTANDTSEAGRVEIYTLDDQGSFPTGTQSVVLQGCTATAKWATCSTVTCSVGSRSQYNAGNVTNTTTAANATVTVTTTATTLLYGGAHGGLADPAGYAPTANYTGQYHNDWGALSSRTERRTSEVASGSIVYDFTSASDDYCIAAVALREYTPSAPPILVMQPRGAY